MNLTQTKINHEYIIDKINIDKCTSIRLQVLGVLKGTRIIVINRMRSGAIILKVRGTRLGINKKVAEKIKIIEKENGESFFNSRGKSKARSSKNKIDSCNIFKKEV